MCIINNNLTYERDSPTNVFSESEYEKNSADPLIVTTYRSNL